MVVATKKPRGEEKGVSESQPATRRGGDMRIATDAAYAAPNTLPSDSHGDDERSAAGQAAGENKRANEVRIASRKHKGRSSQCLNPVELVNGHAGGEDGRDAGYSPAARKTNGHANGRLSPDHLVRDQAAGGGECQRDAECKVAPACRAIQELQRRKVAALKSRMMIDNQLAALVSIELGYHASLEEADRKRLRKEAEALIKAIDAGDDIRPELDAVRQRVAGIVSNTMIAREGFATFLGGIEKEMIRHAKTLPAAKWCLEQRGFGLLSLATIVGEAGDLSLYANPAKLWKRLGLAPFNGKMPSTWRSGGGLSAEQWTEIGYSPRRRSVMYVISECLVKLNKGAYRQRYDEAKARAAEAHPDWTKGHCHNHAMLLAVKRLVLDLWKEWHK